MTALFQLIEQYGLAVVFFNVLMEQLGLPLPAYPTLVITGALSSRGDYSVGMLLGTAVTAALTADFAWFFIGKRYGRRVLALLCRISLSPDSCVQQTDSVYTRWGAPSLVIAKFIPGFASIASALAGANGTRAITFLIFDGIGATLWAGLAIYLGALFNSAVDELLDVLQQLGMWGGLLILVAFAVFIAAKCWQRYRFLKSLRMARITVHELDQMLQQGRTPVIVDVRSALSQKSGRIPGAVKIDTHEMHGFVPDVVSDDEVIVYCACPNEASAALVAKQLMKKGYRRVRPLTGGIDAWIAAGYGVET